MKKIILPRCVILAILSVAVLSTTSAQADQNEKTTNAVKTIEASKLRGVKASSRFQVTIKQGAVSSAVVSVDSRLQPYLIAEVRDGILVLGFDNLPSEYRQGNSVSIQSLGDLWDLLTEGSKKKTDQKGRLLQKAEVTLTSLELLHASSSADIIGVGEFSSPNNCEIKASSSGDVKDINLTAQKINIQASSSGDVSVSAKASHIGITASSSGDVYVNAEADNIGIQASSSADVTVNGTADKLVVKTSSSGSAYLAGLKASEVQADASSSSDIECFVTEKIRAHASSSADIRYGVGSIDVDVNTSSSSSGSCKQKSF